ncbi:MAG TPA: hypothetical protein VFG72_14735 [Marmoricola sp.]|nr:hypothetical protein [Marmoricola sp.]
MTATWLRSATGACAVAGGGVWLAACLALAALPRGCIGDECLTHPQRVWSPLASALVVAAFALVVASALGILVVARSQRGRSATSVRLGGAAALAGAAGGGLLVLGALLAALGVPGMDDAMPGFVVAGVVLCVAAAILTACLVAQSRLLPTWLAILLVVTALLMLGANEQTTRILLAAPFGAAWALVGTVLLRDAAVPGHRGIGSGAAQLGSANPEPQ